MGLDISFVREVYEYGFRAGSYSGFHEFRRVLAAEEGLDLENMSGFGGIQPWEESTSTIQPFLNHSDCDGAIYWYEAEKMIPRFEQIVEKWGRDDFAWNKTVLDEDEKRFLTERLQSWLDAFRRIVQSSEEDETESIRFC